MKREDFVFSVSFCLAYNLPQPPPPPQKKKIKDGKMAGFGFRAASSLICGGRKGWVFAVLFSIMSKIVGLPRRLSRESQLLTDMSYIRLHCAFSVRMYNDLNQGGA